MKQVHKQTKQAKNIKHNPNFAHSLCGAALVCRRRGRAWWAHTDTRAWLYLREFSCFVPRAPNHLACVERTGAWSGCRVEICFRKHSTLLWCVGTAIIFCVDEQKKCICTVCGHTALHSSDSSPRIIIHLNMTASATNWVQKKTPRSNMLADLLLRGGTPGCWVIFPMPHSQLRFEFVLGSGSFTALLQLPQIYFS